MSKLVITNNVDGLTRNKDTFPLWIIMLYIAFLYTNIGITVGGIYIGGTFSLFITFLIFNLQNNKFDTVAFTFYIGLLLLTAYAFSLGNSSFYFERFKSSMLALISITSGYIIYKSLLETKTDILQRLVRYLVFFLVFGTLLEYIGVIRGMSDAFRNYAFANAFVYDSDLRDLRDFGAVRPNLFTQEPSHLAKMIGLVAFANYALNPNKRGLFASVGMLLYSLVIVKSPTVMSSLALIGILHFALRARLKASLNILLLISAFVILVMVQLLPWIAALVPGPRADRIAQQVDSSAIERFFAPAQIAIESLRLKPFFGIGIGSKEEYLPMTVQAYSQFPYYDFNRLVNDGDTAFGWYSALYEGIATIGVVGMLGVIAICIRFYRPLAWSSVVLIMVLVFFLDSGFPSTRSWGYFAVTLFFFDRALRNRDCTRSALIPNLGPPEAGVFRL